MKARLGVAALAASLVCGAAHATTYPAIYSFGDSLSDVGNVFVATGGAFPLPEFYTNGLGVTGRFTNGPNWLDDLSAKLGLSMSPALSLPPGNDFAVGGAQTGKTIVNSPPAPIDLTGQVAAFQTADSSPASGALYTLDIGGNDILNAVTALKAGKITFADMTTTFLNAAVANTVRAVSALRHDGMQTLLYYEVPDLSVVPDFKALGAPFSADARTLAMDFNTDVLTEVKALDPGLDVVDVPIFSAIDRIVAHPGVFGFTSVTSPCFSGSFDTAGSVCGDPNSFLFWDGEHPTAVAHAITADLAFDVLTGTPTNPALAPEASTWAMMLLGFSGLGLFHWCARTLRVAKARAAARA